MTEAQLTRRREYQRKRSARIDANFERKNPGKVPLSMAVIWPRKMRTP
mgnify:FL=1